MIAQNGNIPVFVKILCFYFCMLLKFSEELWMSYLLHSIFNLGYMLCCNQIKQADSFEGNSVESRGLWKSPLLALLESQMSRPTCHAVSTTLKGAPFLVIM
jgi:hypothetical protein